MLPTYLSTPPSPTVRVEKASVRVEKATSELLLGPDWTMNMDICDSINSDPLHAKDFVKAVKKRLQNKNPRIQFLTLTLLETMIKNCGDFVHFQVVDREILPEMVKLVRKTTDMQVRDKVLVLLDSWQEAFGGPEGKYPQYYFAYAELKTSGFQFPQHQKDSALIYTPAMLVGGQPQVGYGIPSGSTERLGEVMASETRNFSLSDLGNIRTIMELFNDMLQAVNQEDRGAIKDEVISDLANQCRVNQKKLLQLINSTENEELMGEALALNDSLQAVLAKHDAIASGSALPPETHGMSRISAPAPSVSYQFEDKDDEETVVAGLANRSSIQKSTGDDVSPAWSDMTTVASTAGVSEASPSVAGNALVPLDPTTPVTATNKEQDMIDLLGLTLSTNPSPQTPVAPPPPPPNMNQNPFSADPPPQALTSNEECIAYNSYVVPWAQRSSLPHQDVAQYPHNYTPWNSNPQVSSNPFLSQSSFQYPASQSPSAPLQPQAPSHSMALQKLNSFGSRENQLNPSNALKQTGSPAAHKPFIMPDKLFDDLIELRNPDGSLKSRSASTLWGSSGQGMSGGRK
ncbi:hypothetical protein AXF42_Ash008090 [Apostasia shenzhenica]|uniref:TOM1-like protein 2 n=1 Tax=Apostasia shenzhenica TaxID=1088818 RepID=A0A2I0A8J2_9ASPA|nr:hypothetical protein AXF42_Ash008090 [Apostasia shenzhenica]